MKAEDLKVGDKVFVELEVIDTTYSAIDFVDPAFNQRREREDVIVILREDINILEAPKFEYGEEIEVKTYGSLGWNKRIFIAMNESSFICVDLRDEEAFKKGYSFRVNSRMWILARKITKPEPNKAIINNLKELLAKDENISEEFRNKLIDVMGV